MIINPLGQMNAPVTLIFMRNGLENICRTDVLGSAKTFICIYLNKDESEIYQEKKPLNSLY